MAEIDRFPEGGRLDQVLSAEAEITRSAAQKWIADGRVQVNGKVVTSNGFRTKAGDVLTFDPPEPVLPELLPQCIPLDVVYEDADLLVVNKPQGMVVHPAPGNPDGTLVNALLYHCGDSLSGINGVIRPGIVHRIDRDTSGLLAVAKNDTAHLSLAKQIASHACERRYECIALGHMREDRGTVDAPIGRHPADRKKMAVVAGGREARTHYTVKADFPAGCCYLALQLETGRTHQIRVHLAHLGHPILGDPLYGQEKHPLEGRFRSLLQGQCLHARTLSFHHPRTGELLHFESPLPENFSAILNRLQAL